MTPIFIEEIHKVEVQQTDLTKNLEGHNVLKVSLTGRYQGITQKYYRIWTEHQWEEIKKQGYFLQ